MRAAISQTTTKAAPSSADAGISTRWSAPAKRRTIWGASSPTKLRSPAKLTAAPASRVGTVLLEESPVNLECRVTQVIPLGSHDLFLAECVAVDVDERLLDENGKLCLNRARLIVYSHGDYLALGRRLGTFGYSVRKRRPRR